MASPSGPFPVGHTHNYTCHVDNDPLHEPYTTCQENGKWTDVVFMCQRTKHESIGCYVDHTRHRVLEFGPRLLSPNGRSHCSTYCSTRDSYKYFGLQTGNECYCGNEIRANLNSSLAPPDDCKVNRCQNNPGEWCGGAWRIEIFIH
ncbi:xylosyltransferase sqv-6-like [Crassostrea virginica]